RIHAWAQRRGQDEQRLNEIRYIDIAARNRFGRPVQYHVADSKLVYTMRAEDLRTAINTDAADGPKLFSSFVEDVANEPDRVRFIGGHGNGHGVGMCQYCAEARSASMGYEDIVTAAYPGSVIVRAY